MPQKQQQSKCDASNLKGKPSLAGKPSDCLEKLSSLPLDQRDFAEMEKGHRVCKLIVLKKFDIVYRRIWLNQQTHQLALTKWTLDTAAVAAACSSSSIVCNGLANIGIGRTCSAASLGANSKTHTLDLRLVKDAILLGKLLNSSAGCTLQIVEKWRRDCAMQRFDPSLVLCIVWGTGFLLNNWLILFDSKEACHLWSRGLRQICAEQVDAPHALVVERWLRKQFFALLPEPTSSGCISIKQMKPFVQQRLQYKVASKQLQEITDGEMGFEGFLLAYNQLLDFHALFLSMFPQYCEPHSPQRVGFQQFYEFHRDLQKDSLGQSKELASDFLRRYLRDVDPDRDGPEPWLSTTEFMDFLYSPENSLFDPVNKEVVHDMTKPLTNYWISSSHNTYLTGDQLKSESSLDAYSRALLMGCRCIELDCWDGPQRRGPGGECCVDSIVIYHGYTMTSKLALRDVLHTIRAYAFRTSDFPLILSIEDNCSVPAQRQMAADIVDILGDLLLTAPVSRDEWQLPSPAALAHKIILKHKKLQMHREEADSTGAGASSSLLLMEDELEQDILSRRCAKKGVLWLRGGPAMGGSEKAWARHIFVLFSDRLCFLVQPIDSANEASANSTCQKSPAGRENSLSSQGEENMGEEAGNAGEASASAVDACAEAHITEEWFHGKVDRDGAKARLLDSAKAMEPGSSNGLFLVRESTTFIGDFTLSFLHNAAVHHCRIKASLGAGGERKYFLLDTVRKDSLYELISFYTRHSLDTPNFKTSLQTPCPQPQPQRGRPWYSEQADTQQAEELLNRVGMDGAFLVRHSTSDRSVFVLSLRIDGKLWHYRLKREGRVFVVNEHIFENLCELVDFYERNQFVRGVSLKYPVNEQTVDHYTSNQMNGGGGGMASGDSAFGGGFYMELKDLAKEVQVEAIKPFDGQDLAKTLPSEEHEKCLNFPAGARITVLQKGQSRIWLGRYNDQVGWFPADCVQEGSPLEMALDSIGPGSELNYGTIELVGTSFKQTDCLDRPNAFLVSLAQSHWNVEEYLLAADSPEDMGEWLAACQQQAQQANDKMHQLRTKEKQLRIASELSSLVVYCQAVPFNPDFELQDARSSFYEMCSFSESKHDKLVERGLTTFNQRQLSRVYPQASRLTSANFNPVPMWNTGCHMVALNFQTGDKPMQLNAGRFWANGRCGYVLKPQYMMEETFRHFKATKLCRWCRNNNKRKQRNASFAALSPLPEAMPVSAKALQMDLLTNANGTLAKGETIPSRPPKLSLATSSSEAWTTDEEFAGSTGAGGGGDEEDSGFCTCEEETESVSTTLVPPSPVQAGTPHQNCAISLHVLIISGRNLSRKCGYDKGGICSPYVELELLGFPHDSQVQRTNTITSNGLNPVWQEHFHFFVQHPEVCLLRFFVEDGDFVGPKADPFIGQATLPLDCIRPGFRSVPLLNQFSEPLELSALLVHVEIRHWTPPSPTANPFSATSSLLLGTASTFGGGFPRAGSALNLAQSIPQQTDSPPILNVHKILQSGRSLYSGAEPAQIQRENAGEANSRLGLNRNVSMESRRMHWIQNNNNNQLAPSQGPNSNRAFTESRRTSASTSIESGETTASSSPFFAPHSATSRPMGTNTLRRIFRLGRNN